MAELAPSGLSAVAWTVASVGVGAISGALVDYATNILAPLKINGALVPNVGSVPSGSVYFPLPSFLPIGAGDPFYVDVTSTIPLVARVLLQLVVGVFTAGELMQLVTGVTPNTIVPIGDGSLLFWFFISQPFLIASVGYLLLSTFQRFVPPSANPAPPTSGTATGGNTGQANTGPAPSSAALAKPAEPKEPPKAVAPAMRKLDLNFR